MDHTNDQSLRSRVALLSGGLGSIGQAIALELGRRGAAVSLADLHSPAAAVDLLKQCEGEGISALYRQLDVSSFSQVQSWIEQTEAELGTATIVVPCAAVVTRLGVREIDAPGWRREMQINLDGSFHLAQQAALRMVAQNVKGSIIFIGSWVAERPHPRITTYCVGKAALRMLMKCMALDLAGDGITVNEVAPGFVDAGLTGQTLKVNPERRSALIEQTPIRRLIESGEVALHVADLCDPRSSGITGTTILIDGGVSLGSP